jgi:hypothetical protein
MQIQILHANPVQIFHVSRKSLHGSMISLQGSRKSLHGFVVSLHCSRGASVVVFLPGLII